MIILWHSAQAQVAPIRAHLDMLDNKVISSSYRDTVTQSSYHDTITQSSYHDSEIVKLMAFPINKVSSEVKFLLPSEDNILMKLHDWKSQLFQCNR